MRNVPPGMKMLSDVGISSTFVSGLWAMFTDFVSSYSFWRSHALGFAALLRSRKALQMSQDFLFQLDDQILVVLGYSLSLRVFLPLVPVVQRPRRLPVV